MNKTKYTYEKTDDIEVIVEIGDGQYSKRTLNKVYDVFGVIPNWFSLVVHKMLPHEEYKESWVVSEKSTGMLLVHPEQTGKIFRTRDAAVEMALENIKTACPTAEAADLLLSTAQEELRHQKQSYIDKVLNEESN